ncbi:OmpA family protein [uncultured Pseudoalteromonas sp.]|uniref:OmpA family protein n=1 Tax=uncultured Pseudoalteromonas sp. TaxID=114053 RepID=UPI0025FA914D|nr:OmpA family protein [uncultured Pseudoalteromonas sp.]
MKLKSLTIALAIAATSTTGFAAEKEGFYIGVFGDYYDASWIATDYSKYARTGYATGMGAELGYRFSDNWGARLEYVDENVDIESLVTGDKYDHDMERYGIDLLYHFSGGPFYGLVGVKEIDVYTKDTYGNIGLGYQHFLTDGLSLNVEASYYGGFDHGESDFNSKFGVSYLFGQSSSSKPVEPAPVVAAPTDSDNDGVMDADDQCANTPMTDAVDSTGCTLYEEKEATITLLVTFPHDVAEVPNQYFSDIADVAAFMKENEGTSVVLEGHASAVGDADYNMMLSEKRAKDVAEELVKDGISSDRISTVGYGEERLKNKAYTLEAHAENRRVEAQITSVEKVKVLRK